MGTPTTYDFEGTNGATLAGSGITLTGSGTAVFATSEAVVGGTGALFTATAGQVRTARLAITPGATQCNDMFLRTPTSLPTSPAVNRLATLRHTGGGVISVEQDSTGTICIFENATSTRTQIPSAVVAVNTKFRLSLRSVVGVATVGPFDGSLTAKVYSSASNWTTQVGTTLTRSAINLGTNVISVVDVGALTALTPGLIVGADYIRSEDGKTTEFGAPPTASDPVAAIGADDQYPEEDAVVTFNYTGSTAGSGSITGYSLVCTAFPAGAAAPAITGPTTATPSFTPSTGGQYAFTATITQTGGLTDDATITIYSHVKSNVDVLVRRVIDAGGWTVEGTGAASLLEAINSPSTANWAQSPTNPVASQKLVLEMDPFGPGSVDGIASGLWSSGALDLNVEIYLEDGVTLLQVTDFDMTSVLSESTTSLDSGDLATAPPGAGRRALVVKLGAE